MPRLLIATGNQGKFAEFQVLLAGIPYELVSLRDMGITQTVEETGSTYQENARLKAEAYARASGLPTLADDSGIEVEALGNEPGVYSARYGGEDLTDMQRVELLLRNLAAVPGAPRTARFVCVIAIAWPGRETQFARGECPGAVASAPRGENGFGYDPIFLLPDLDKTMAELPAAQKNVLSHRGRAAQQAKALLMGTAPNA